MPAVIDWPTVPDPPGVVQAAADAVRAGQVVVLPTESGYVFAANALSSEAADKLRRLVSDETAPWPMAVRGMADVRDWVPGLGSLGQRLVRRLWPGPVTFGFSDAAAESVTHRLPESVRSRVFAAGGLQLRSPTHEVVPELLRHLTEPLLLVDVPLAGAEPVTGRRLAETLGEDVALILDDGPAQFPEGPAVLHIAGTDWRVERAGALAPDLIQRQAACLVVFVCTG